ncbi:MAG: Gfo/Idh/MocA family oxidoreductase, partial [Thermomicrobiales bacterium]|nr:Gfo/Idh/MocA family oxidoreductase [Thermomicrobiales bacterium]
MTDETVRWGVIGCGQIAYDRAMPALEMAPNCDLVALADPDSERLAKAQGRFAGVAAYATTEALLADDAVQAVYIATPNFMHCDQAIAAAKAGKHVLVEKPMALNAAEGRRMVAAADAAGVKLMAAYMTLFNPAYQAAKRLIETGLLGEIVAMRGRHSYPINPESIYPAAIWRLDPNHGGGPLMDVGVYSIFTLRDLTGKRPRSLSATGTLRRLHGKTQYDSIVASFETEDGTTGVIEANFTFTSSHFEVEGTGGRLALSRHISQLIDGKLEAELRSKQRPRMVSQRIIHEVDPAGLPEFANYLGEVEHFADCIRTGREPISSGQIAVCDLEVADAVRESLRS